MSLNPKDVRVIVRVTPEVVEALDGLMTVQGFPNRSTLLRYLINQALGASGPARPTATVGLSGLDPGDQAALHELLKQNRGVAANLNQLVLQLHRARVTGQRDQSPTDQQVEAVLAQVTGTTERLAAMLGKLRTRRRSGGPS